MPGRAVNQPLPLVALSYPNSTKSKHRFPAVLALPVRTLAVQGDSRPTGAPEVEKGAGDGAARRG
jgi:hypothetical protein